MLLPLLSDAELERIKEEYSFSGTCPTCLGKGSYRLYDEEHECNCPEQIRLTKAYYLANIGQHFHVLGWDNFRSADRDIVLPPAQEFVANFAAFKRYGLVLTFSGPPGTGKSLLLCCVLKDLIKQGHSCYFVQGTTLVNLWGASWSDPVVQKRLETQLKRVDVLGLDDLRSGGSDKHTTFVAAAIEDVIRHRYNQSLPTLITTNLELDQQKDDQPLAYSLLAGRNEWYYTKVEDQRTLTSYHLSFKNLALNGEVLPVV
jgi:DNA replication protein DnaC